MTRNANPEPSGEDPSRHRAAAPDEVATWVAAAVDGDREAMQRLLLLYHDGFRQFVARSMEPRIKARLEPEDVLQGAYADACNKIADCQFDGPGGFYEWLRTIIRNKLTDEQRALWSAKRDPRREVHGDPRASYADLFDRLVSPGRTPSRMAARLEGAAVITTCLAQLKKEYREVIQLRFLEGLPVADVMERMGKSEGAVHMLCHRALREMRTMMQSASRFLSQG